jgi:manganese transport protein
LIIDQITTWVHAAGEKAWLVQITVIPFTVYLGILLLYVTFHPWIRERKDLLHWPRIGSVHRQPVQENMKIEQPLPYQRVAVALDFSGSDEKLLAESLRFIDKARTQLTLLHVVESPLARTLGAEAEDLETLADRERLEKLALTMRALGITTEGQLGKGEPAKELARIVNELDIELLLVGGHGHTGVSDLVHGTVISDLRHHIKSSIVVIPLKD